MGKVVRTLPEAPPIRVEELVHTGALEALRPEWSALWERCPTATPFQTPEWLLPWWRRFGAQKGWELWALVLRRDGRLVGLAPLFFHPATDPSLRQVSPLGIGITDYLGVLLDPEHAAEGAARILRHLAERGDRWDVCDLEQLRVGSPLLDAPAPPGLATEAVPQGVCPVVPLPDTPDALRAGLSAWMRRNIRQGQRRLGEVGELRFETADARTLGEYLDALFALHGARWRNEGLPGVFTSEEIRGFHREAATGLLARGVLRMHGMRLDGRLVAVFYCLLGKGRGYAYQSGFAPELSRSSPGTLIVDHAIEDAIRAGAREFDFLRGTEDYKYNWGAVDQLRFWLRVRHASGEGG